MICRHKGILIFKQSPSPGNFPIWPNLIFAVFYLYLFTVYFYGVGNTWSCYTPSRENFQVLEDYTKSLMNSLFSD